MTFTIPAWLLWTLAAVVGVPVVALVLVFAAFGFAVARSFKGGIWR